MKFISCFSGIEAASVASAPLGWKALAFSEIDPFACAALAHHYPTVPNLGDITKVDWSQYHGKADIVCGGSPCQAFSVAGLRKSLQDPRGNLTLEYMRTVHGVKPEWVMWEQVPGVFSAAGNPFGCFLAGLGGYDDPIEPPDGKWGSSGFLMAKDEDGYSLAWRVLDAQYFGVPQRRRRIFLVGHLGKRGWWKPLEVLFEREGLQRDSAPCRKAKEEAAGNAGEGFAGSHWDGTGVHPTLNQSAKVSGGIGASNQEIFSQRGGGLVQTPIAFNWMEARNFKAEEGTTNPLRRCQTEAVARMVAFGEYAVDGTTSTQKRRDYKDATDLVVSVQNATRGKSQNGLGVGVGPMYTLDQGSQHAISHCGTRVRRLTPTECERLQGFPDGHTAVPFNGKTATDGHRYKALGNSWAVPVVRWIFTRIQALHTIK